MEYFSVMMTLSSKNIMRADFFYSKYIALEDTVDPRPGEMAFNKFPLVFSDPDPIFD